MSVLKNNFIFISLFIYIYSYLQEYKTTIDGKELIYKSYKLIKEETKLDIGQIASQDFYDVTLLVVDGAKLTITKGSNIVKNIPESNLRNLLQENEDDFYKSDDYKYGLTSNIVAIGINTKVIIESASINVDCPFSNAIMAFNGAEIKISNTTIITKKKYSKGLVVSNDAFVEIEDQTNFFTEGDFSPCLEVNRELGFIEAELIYLYSIGKGSPLLNNIGNGKVNIFTGYGKAHNSQIMVVQGTNKILLHNCRFSCSGKGNDFYDQDSINNGGVVLYNTDEFDNDFTEVTLDNCIFSIEGEPVIIGNIPMFSCYDIEGSITLTNTQTSFNTYFMKAYQIDGSHFNTKITLDINKIGVKGKIQTIGDAFIYLTYDQELSEVELEGNIEVP